MTSNREKQRQEGSSNDRAHPKLIWKLRGVARQHKRWRNPDGRARCLSDVAVVNGATLRPSWRSRIPARREGVLESNCVFRFLLIREGHWLRERSRGRG